LLFQPAADERTARRRSLLVITANWHILLGTIDGADFGAPNDPFRSKNEKDVEIGIGLDLLRLIPAR
jgi:hypothetical protein